MGNYTLTNDFFVIDLVDIDIILEPLDQYTQSFGGLFIRDGWQHDAAKRNVK